MRAAPFNTDFYAVAATVMPVLYIALMIPPGLVARTVQAAHELKGIGKTKRRDSWAFHFLRGFAFLVYLLFFAGELSALGALDERKATGGAHLAVYTAVTALVVAAALSGLATAMTVSTRTGSGGGSAR